MKNLYKYCFLLLFLSFSFNSFSQQKNSVKLYSTGFSIPEYGHAYNKKYAFNSITAITGISYERKIQKNFAIGGQYAIWWGKPLSNRGRIAVISNEFTGDSASIGQIITRSNFNTFDVYGVYNIMPAEKIKIGFKAGPSVTRGENEYLRSLAQPYDCFLPETETIKETYFGAFTSLSFDYIFWQGRIPVGVDLSGRFYRHFPFQVNYGLHVGYNF